MRSNGERFFYKCLRLIVQTKGKPLCKPTPALLQRSLMHAAGLQTDAPPLCFIKVYDNDRLSLTHPRRAWRQIGRRSFSLTKAQSFQQSQVHTARSAGLRPRNGTCHCRR